MENIPCFHGWKIVRKIGRGQYGAVYEIQRKLDGEDVECSAMKVISVPPDGELASLRAEYGDDATVTTLLRSRVESISSEFKLMSQLQGHSNIVSYHDHQVVQHDDQMGWDVLIRMELLTSLPDYTNGKSVEDSVAIRLGMDICRALARCEECGILHRDIKPQNIFVNKYGDFKLGDFGVARATEHMTASSIAGTYDYMAPEVYSHALDKQGHYDKRVDIYSLGLVLYWLLNERRGSFLPLPPKGFSSESRNAAWQMRMRGESLPRPAHGSRELQDIVLKACAFQPEDRYQNAAEFYDALKRLDETIPMPYREVFLTPVQPASPETPEKPSETDNGETISAFGDKSGSGNHEAKPTNPLTSQGGGAREAQKKSPKSLLFIAAACVVVVLIGVLGYTNCWFGHRWDEGAITTAASHTAVGTKTYTCSVCGKTREETIAQLVEHTYDQETVDAQYLKTEATCTDSAVYYKSCVCGEMGTETFTYGEANGHTWDEGTVTTAATHTSAGETVYTCTVCGQTREETIAKLTEHTYDQEIVSAQYLRSEATCTEPAMYFYSCECGEAGTETFTYGETKGHSWDNKVESVPATHTSTGKKVYTCSVCGQTKEEIIAKLTKHTYNQEIVDAKYLKSEATCTEPAVYYYSCECGEKGAKTFEYGKANGHKWDSGTVTVAATHTSTGTIKYTCTVCHDTYKETIAKTKTHTYNQRVTSSKYLKSAATCTSAAVYYYSCECGEKGTETFTSGSANGHTYNQKVTSSKYLKSNATCTEPAVYYYSCECGQKGTKTFTSGSANGHTYNQQVTSSKYLKSAATCTSAAVYYKSCKCGQKGTATFTYGSAKGHTWQAATYTEPKTCSVCGATTGNVKGYRASVEGEWSSQRQSFAGYKLSYLIFSDKLTNCTAMTVHVDVTKNYGPEYETWVLWARIDGWFQNIKEFTLSGGEGSATITIKFDEPTTVDAITISPKSRGGAIQWNHSIWVTDAYCRD